MDAVKRYKNPELVKLLVDNGAKLCSKDNRNRSPLHYACSLFGNDKVVQKLID